MKKYKRMWLLSDIHFGVRSNSLGWMESQKEFFDNFFIPLLKEKSKPGDCVFILGDIFDNRQTINVLTQNFAFDIFNDLSKILPLYALLGNHDVYYKNNNDVHSLKVIEPFFQKIYSKPELMENVDKKILILPWCGESVPGEKTNEGKVIDRYSSLDYVFAHTEIKNSYFNGTQVSDDGMSNDDMKKISKKLISGHIHIRQEKDKYLYLGSPMSYNKGDRGNAKGIHLLDLDNDRINFIENEISPKFLNISFNEFMTMSIHDYNKLIDNNFVNIIIPDTYSNIFPFNKLNEMSTNAKDITFDLLAVGDVEYGSLDFTSDEVSGDDFNLLRLLGDYVKNLNFSDDIKTKINSKITDLKSRSSIQG